MTTSLMVRRGVAALLSVALCLAALPGCGSTPSGAKKDDKKEDPKPAPGPDTTPKSDTTPKLPLPPEVPPKSTLGPIEPDAEKFATAFLRDVMHGTAKHDTLTPAFVKAIGKPYRVPGDTPRGYSEDAATSWLKAVGEGINFGLAMQQDQAGEVVYIRGSISGPRLGKEAGKTGSYSLRLLKTGGAWKVDWLSLSSVTPPDKIQAQVVSAPTAEGAAQGFAAAAFVESVADLNGMPKDERVLVIAAAMTPSYRALLTAPLFDQDKNLGYDFNPGKLSTEAVKIGGGTSAFVAARVGDLAEFKVELTKPAGKKTYTVKLVKGTAPHEWLVSEVTEAK